MMVDTIELSSIVWLSITFVKSQKVTRKLKVIRSFFVQCYKIANVLRWQIRTGGGFKRIL